MSFCRVGEHPKMGGSGESIVLLNIVEKDTELEFYYNGNKLEEMDLSTYATDENPILISEEIVRKAEKGILIICSKSGIYTPISQYQYRTMDGISAINFVYDTKNISIADKVPVM